MKIIGLMSGTSVDGIDAALVEVTGQGYAIEVELLAAETFRYQAGLRSQILSVCGGQALSMADLAHLDDAIALAFAEAAHTLMAQTSDVTLIASHGQTVFHRPPDPDPGPASKVQLGYSLQLGRGALIAAQTACPTISNFRSNDIALGGQGAPLVCPVDVCLLSHPQQSRCIQNIGGIGNVTYLPPWQPDPHNLPTQVQGWDTGPGNALIDWAVSHFTQGQQTYDQDGQWAAQGTPQPALIARWLADPFFHQKPPKSTGRERFGADFARECWQLAQTLQISQVDLIASLTDLTAATIEHSYRQFLPALPPQVIIGGGGSHNPVLLKYLQQRLPETTVLTTDAVSLNADYKEAIAFAVLGFWRWHQVPGNLPAVTGARTACLLGEISIVG